MDEMSRSMASRNLPILIALSVLLGIDGHLNAQPSSAQGDFPVTAPAWVHTVHPASTSYEVIEHKVFRRTNGRLVDPNLFPSAEFASDGTQIMPRSWVARTPERFDYITFRQDRHAPPADLGNPKSMSSRMYWTESGDLLNLGGPDRVRGLEGAVMRWDRRNLRDFQTEATQREAGIVGLASALEGVIDRHPELFLPDSVRRAQDVATTPVAAGPHVYRTTWTDAGHRFEVDAHAEADGLPRVIAVKVQRIGPTGVNLEVRATEFARTDTGRWAWTSASGQPTSPAAKVWWSTATTPQPVPCRWKIARRWILGCSDSRCPKATASSTKHCPSSATAFKATTWSPIATRSRPASSNGPWHRAT